MVKEKEKTAKQPAADLKSTANVITFQDLGLEGEESPCARSFATYVRTLNQNRRQGTLGCKTRGEIAFSNKKPWKQKGTGRARVGSRRSPLWRKGGIIFGPQPRIRTLKVSRELKKRVLRSLLWQNLEHKRIISLPWDVGDAPKTSAAYQALKNANLHGKKVILFVKPDDMTAFASFNNIHHVQVMLFDQPNAYDLGQGSCWVFLQKNTDAFKEMVKAWK